MTIRRRYLIAAHGVGNALLLWLGYRWLGMNESNGWHLGGSLAVGALIIIAFAGLHGGALAQWSGLPITWRKLGKWALLCLAAIVIYGILGWLQPTVTRVAFTIASFLTLHLRTPIAPSVFETIFKGLRLALQWAVVPAALFRWGKQIAAPDRRTNHRHFLLFALAVGALLFVAIWIPWKLFFWVPDLSSFAAQFASLLARVGIGYGLFTGGLLGIEFLASRDGKPAETQPITLSRP